MPTVLSTKRLTAVQKKHLFLSNIGLVEYDAVQIKPIDLKLITLNFENAIFTSQNSVRFAKAKGLKIKHAFCVGQNTAKALEGFAENIEAIAENGQHLSNLIVQNYSNRFFHFFCSRQRRMELPEQLTLNHITFQEHYLYESVINLKSFENRFDAVLCFSPLGVKAYYNNHNATPPAICIGTTTEQAAKKYTSTFTASKTSIESVIIKAIKVLNHFGSANNNSWERNS